MVAFPFCYVDLFRNGGNLRMPYPLMCFNGAIVLQIVQNHSFLRKKRKDTYFASKLQIVIRVHMYGKLRIWCDKKLVFLFKRVAKWRIICSMSYPLFCFTPDLDNKLWWSWSKLSMPCRAIKHVVLSLIYPLMGFWDESLIEDKYFGEEKVFFHLCGYRSKSFWAE